MTQEWIDCWRDLADMTTGIEADSPKGKKVLGLLSHGDSATANKELPMLRFVRSQLRGVTRDKT